MFEAYITNTALYPLMGIEVGTTVHFPMTTQELQAALAKIGIDGKRYSEVFFSALCFTHFYIFTKSDAEDF